MKSVRIGLAAALAILTLVGLPISGGFAGAVDEATCCAPTVQLQTALVVSPEGPYTSIQDALTAAQDGDHITVQGGTYLGPLIIEKSVVLEGVGEPVIDGGGVGTVVTLNAPGAALRGFTIRGSGVEPDRDHAGITITASDVIVENNHLSDVLFGIFVAQADRAVVRGNQISSKLKYEQGRRGDSIRLWYSQDVIVEGNHVNEARDVVMWYSNNVIVRGNHIENGRYGIHLMYCDRALIENNILDSNSVGIYTMYSRGVILLNNIIRRQRGPSGYALGFKDADAVLVQDNLLLDNHSGVFLDGTPFTPSSFARFEGNIIAFNDVGATLLSAVHGVEFTANTFWENVEQVALQGGGKAGENRWQANYWSDYTGFDVDGDGQGESPYQADRYFESLMDREPLLRALLFSPAAQTIEFAATSFPIFKPQPKLSDSTPSTVPGGVPGLLSAAQEKQNAWGMAFIGAGMLSLCALLGGWIYWREVISWREAQKVEREPTNGLELA